MNHRDNVYVPFLRRFTDERAHDLAETVNLYKRVIATRRASLWAREDAIERVSDFIVEQVTELVELPNSAPVCRALDKCQRDMLALETVIFSEPAADFSKPL